MYRGSKGRYRGSNGRYKGSNGRFKGRWVSTREGIGEQRVGVGLIG